MSKFYIRAYKGDTRIRTIGCTSNSDAHYNLNNYLSSLLISAQKYRWIYEYSTHNIDPSGAYYFELVKDHNGEKRIYEKIITIVFLPDTTKGFENSYYLKITNNTIVETRQVGDDSGKILFK